MAKIKLGYVGCGFMAQNVHIPNFASIPECELIALAEVRAELGRKVQKRFGIPNLYPDHQTLLAAPGVEAIAVSAEFMVQAQIARDALKAGKHVFMEKPMATSIQQADEMLAAARQSSCQLMVAYMKRYDAGNELVKSKVAQVRASGELGPITFARNHGFCGTFVSGGVLDMPMDTTDDPIPIVPEVGPDWLPPEFLEQYLEYLQQYTHNVNLLRWFLDAGDDVSVRAVDLDDDGFTGVAILEMAGTRVVVESGQVSHFRWDEHTQIYFRDGWIQTWAPPLLLKQVPAEVEIYRAGDAQAFTRVIPRPAWSWSYKREAEHFIECLQTDKPVRSSGEDTRTDVRLFEEMFRMHLSQRGVL